MGVLVLLSIFVISAYTTAVCIKQKGVPYSISTTFYKLKHPYWFMATMWLTAGMLMPAILETSKTNTEFMAFIACVGMLLVGAAPNFKDSYEGKIHTAGAIMCIVGSQLWVAFNAWYMLVVWLAYLGYTALFMVKEKEGSFWYKFYQSKPMFWVEIAAFLSTYLSLLIKYTN